MLSQNNNALGIIFPNSYDNTVPELVTERAMASIPFAGRYRMVDFVLSSMANCGISNVSIVVRKNYHSLMDHLGTGREWDMARRHGGLNIVPPFAEKGVRIYSGRVEALGSILSFLENQKENYVVMSDANIAVNYDFNALLAAHQASGADVTVAYQKSGDPRGPQERQLHPDRRCRRPCDRAAVQRLPPRQAEPRPEHLCSWSARPSSSWSRTPLPAA